MTNDLRAGYSAGLVKIIEGSDPSLLTTRFAKFCVANNISVAQVGTHFGVSRTAVYEWFKGTNTPRAKHAQMMEALMTTA